MNTEEKRLLREEMFRWEEVFRRYEKKYLLTPEQYGGLLRRLEGRLRPDRFFESHIRSLYFDTPDRRLIRRSLEKPVYKEKLRLRGYGSPEEGDRVFVELKKKYKGVVYKRRAAMERRQAEAYLTGKAPAPYDSQIIREIDRFLTFYAPLRPSITITCDRKAWTACEDSRLRFTFDRDIRWREESPQPDWQGQGTGLLPAGWRLMEIKIPAALPLWLTGILGELGIYPVSFSKYGRAYQASRRGEDGSRPRFIIDKEEITCA